MPTSYQAITVGGGECFGFMLSLSFLQTDSDEHWDTPDSGISPADRTGTGFF
jgi:hypothetical protein